MGEVSLFVFYNNALSASILTIRNLQDNNFTEA